AFVVALDRLDSSQIGMRARGDVAAARAMPTRTAIGTRLLAEQRLREMKREAAFADAAPAGDEKRMRPARAPREGFARNLLLPGQQRLPAGRLVCAPLAHLDFKAARRSCPAPPERPPSAALCRRPACAPDR